MSDAIDIAFVGYITFEIPEMMPVFTAHIALFDGGIQPYLYLHEITRYLRNENKNGNHQVVANFFDLLEKSWSRTDIDVKTIISVGLLEYLSRSVSENLILRRFVCGPLLEQLERIDKDEGW